MSDHVHWRETYAARIAAFRANVSLALPITVANTLLYGADHLSKGNVVLPPDDTSRATRLCSVVAWLPGCYVITVFR